MHWEGAQDGGYCGEFEHPRNPRVLLIINATASLRMIRHDSQTIIATLALHYPAPLDLRYKRKGGKPRYNQLSSSANNSREEGGPLLVIVTALQH